MRGYDTFARETYCAGEYASEAEAKAELERQRRLLAATQDEALRDEVWLSPPPEVGESTDG
ncbi:MAG: hypothetical protein KDJ22_02410 [Candidatus Competibacteraceae bacterium]|nr:hypothetical protein [Candidatus Competibacteraceae bacterium]MCP5124909.1 hypothetical protein [Gammaproteobacteria bacterium]HRX70983.1 hypothetical protein [Candidatus Competibacteraceae bacterium]